MVKQNSDGMNASGGTVSSTVYGLVLRGFKLALTSHTPFSFVHSHILAVRAWILSPSAISEVESVMCIKMAQR